MDIKYNIYYSLSRLGPWTLANETPIDHSDSGNNYTITGLTHGVNYYILVVGGVMDGDTFVPLMTQNIGSLAEGARGIDRPPVNPIKVLNRIPRKLTNSTLYHKFGITV